MTSQGTAVTAHYGKVHQAHREQDAHNDLKAEVQRAKDNLAKQMRHLGNKGVDHGVRMPGVPVVKKKKASVLSFLLFFLLLFFLLLHFIIDGIVYVC